MPNAIETIDDRNLTIGHAGFGLRGDTPGSVRQQVHDGDTITVRAIGNFGIRFLGIDTPEVSFAVPGGRRFLAISDPKWDEFLIDPFAAGLPPFEPTLPRVLREYLRAKTGAGCAANHARHAQLAQQDLEAEVTRDMRALGKTAADFQFFLVFAYEVMDGYGRFLCFANRDQPNPNQPTPRPLTYNERMLRLGRACPYFIWPNINPWRKKDSILDAVIVPGKAREETEQDSPLKSAREWVQTARQNHVGVFAAMDPLLLEPFELRYLARRSIPNRWVIDLSRNDHVLLQPQNYYTIPHAEDRLFINPEHVPLFVDKGWRREV